MTTRSFDDSAAQRNKQPIFEALAAWFAPARSVLEIGAGDGTHARHACQCLPHIAWQTSEAPAHQRRLVAALADGPAMGLAEPLALDVRGRWPARVYDAIYAANVAHIMDWPAVEALFAGAAAHLSADGLLCLYGPFVYAGQTPEPGNATFDASLRARDSAMALREVEALDALAVKGGLQRAADIAMPSDNRLLIWRAGEGKQAFDG